MTNPSPQEPQNPIPERRKRPATGVTFDEMIGIIVAFTTIGAVLFWSLGAKKDGPTNPFAQRENKVLSGASTTATGFGMGNLGFGNSESDLNSDLNNGAAKSEERKLAAKLRESKSSVAAKTPSPKPDPSLKAKQETYELSSGAKLAPLVGGIAASSALKNNPNANIDSNIGNINAGVTDTFKPDTSIPKPMEQTKVKPEASIPEPMEQAKVKPEASIPEQEEVPKDIAPSYWAYPFVKQMSDQSLVADFADDQNFEPDKLITRADMATLISQAFNTQPETQEAKKFKDIGDKKAIAADIDKAVSTGFMQGYSDEDFRPMDNIPRYQVLVTLATGLGLKPSGDQDQILRKFGDRKDMPDWAKQQVAAAIEAGLMVNPPGMSKETLMPNKAATRGEVAAMIHQSLVKTGKLKSLKSEYLLNP